MTTSDPHVRVLCPWCQASTGAGTTACPTCGAPLDGAPLQTVAGWRASPKIKDHTAIRFGTGSGLAVEGDIVPSVELSLDPNDGMMFHHHRLLWKEHHLPLTATRTGGSMMTLMGEMSRVMLSASGPGRLAVSHGQAGELVVLPVRPGQAIDVGEGSFLAANHVLGYTIEKLQGSLRSKLRSTEGFYMERFYATEWPGLLVLHAQGCAFERTLAQGEQLLIDPAAFLYKDHSVGFTTEKMDVATGVMGWKGLFMMRVVGPGRVGIESGSMAD